jgi:hypothetical protein
MFSGELVQYSDEARSELERRYRKAAQAWRFRHIPSGEAKAVRAAVHLLRAAFRGALELVQRALARTRSKRALLARGDLASR